MYGKRKEYRQLSSFAPVLEKVGILLHIFQCASLGMAVVLGCCDRMGHSSTEQNKCTVVSFIFEPLWIYPSSRHKLKLR